MGLDYGAPRCRPTGGRDGLPLSVFLTFHQRTVLFLFLVFDLRPTEGHPPPPLPWCANSVDRT